jgi:hypothetical protein
MSIFGSPWHLPTAWGDIQIWITAIATIRLPVGAYYTAFYAARASGTQAEEIAIFQEERRRDARMSQGPSREGIHRSATKPVSPDPALRTERE